MKLFLFQLFSISAFQIFAFGQGLIVDIGQAASAGGGGGGGTPGFESARTNATINVGLLQLTVTNGGANRVQFIFVGTGDTTQDPIVVLTNSAGQSFTKAWGTNGTGWVRSEGWYLINPPSGSNLVTITWGGGGTIANQAMVSIHNYTNAHQTTPLGTVISNKGTGNPAITIVSATGELPVGGACTDGENSLAVSGGTIRSIFVNFDGDVDSGAATYTGAASVNANWTATAGQNWAAGAVSLKGP